MKQFKIIKRKLNSHTNDRESQSNDNLRDEIEQNNENVIDNSNLKLKFQEEEICD